MSFDSFTIDMHEVLKSKFMLVQLAFLFYFLLVEVAKQMEGDIARPTAKGERVTLRPTVLRSHSCSAVPGSLLHVRSRQLMQANKPNHFFKIANDVSVFDNICTRPHLYKF
jgi:hypothetical protein